MQSLIFSTVHEHRWLGLTPVPGSEVRASEPWQMQLSAPSLFETISAPFSVFATILPVPLVSRRAVWYFSNTTPSAQQDISLQRYVQIVRFYAIAHIEHLKILKSEVLFPGALILILPLTVSIKACHNLGKASVRRANVMSGRDWYSEVAKIRFTIHVDSFSHF